MEPQVGLLPINVASPQKSPSLLAWARQIPQSRKRSAMNIPSTIADYLRHCSQELGERILQVYPALQAPGDPISDRFSSLLRSPFAAQRLAVMGIVKRWNRAKAAAVVVVIIIAIAECGTGKTLISLGAMFVHSGGKPFTALVMAPPQLTLKWCRETLLTLPRVRVFLIDGVRNGVGSNGHTGVNEVRLRNGRILREGLQSTLSDLRLRKQFRSARARWQSLCDCPAVFVISREIGKLSYFWRHAYGAPRSGPFNGSIVNPDTGRPVMTDDDQLRRADFRKTKHSELVLSEEQSNPLKARRTMFSALWQADGSKVRRCAPMDLIGRYDQRHSAPPCYLLQIIHSAARGNCSHGHSTLLRGQPDGYPLTHVVHVRR